MKTLGENIKYLRTRHGLTQPQLAEIAGASSATTISKWESNENSPNGRSLVTLCNYFGVSSDDLLGLTDGISHQAQTEYIFLPTTISAGLPLNVDGISEHETIALPDDMLGKWAGQKDILILKVSGDSMDKLMKDGSLIAVKPTPLENIKDGDIVVFSNRHHEYGVKRYVRRGDKLIFKPESFNDEHDEQHYSDSDQIEIHGKVVMWNVVAD